MTLIHFLDSKETGFNYATSSIEIATLPCPYRVSNPFHFYQFALEDGKMQDERSLVNAFSNMKKAIHIRIDMLLNQYGLFRYYKREKFPKKLMLIEKTSLLPTKMIKNLNAERNLLEHEYSIPTHKRVIEALDVMQLLYLASETVLEKTCVELITGNDKQHLVIRLEPQIGELHIFNLEVAPTSILNGVEVIKGSLRDMRRNIKEEFKIASAPHEIIRLDHLNMEKWLPIIKLFIHCSIRRYFPWKTSVDVKDMSSILPVRIPVFDLEKDLYEYILEFIEKENGNTNIPSK